MLTSLRKESVRFSKYFLGDDSYPGDSKLPRTQCLPSRALRNGRGGCQGKDPGDRVAGTVPRGVSRKLGPGGGPTPPSVLMKAFLWERGEAEGVPGTSVTRTTSGPAEAQWVSMQTSTKEDLRTHGALVRWADLPLRPSCAELLGAASLMQISPHPQPLLSWAPLGPTAIPP